MKEGFKKAASRAGQGSANALIQTVIAERPDLKSALFLIPGRGKCSITIMTDKEVFKAPRPGMPMPEEYCIQEYQFLNHIQKQKLGLPVPHITTIGEYTSFYGMTRMKGTALDVETLSSLPKDEQKRLADQIAEFNVNLSRALNDRDRKRLGLDGNGAEWRMTPDKVIKALEDPETQNALGESLEFCRNLARRFSHAYNAQEAEKRVLTLHSDMHPDNLIYDADSGQLSIIDLGCGRPMEAEIAFSPFKHSYPTQFVDQMLESFSLKSGILITAADIDRQRCLCNILQLPNALKHGDKKAVSFIKDIIRQYKNIHIPKSDNLATSKASPSRRASFR